MARAYNLNQQGQCRLELIEGPDIQIRAGTNSGIVASVVRNGVGDYTVTYSQPVVGTGALGVGGPESQQRAQVEGQTPGFAVIERLTTTTARIRVFTSAAGNAALDASLALKVTQQFVA